MSSTIVSAALVLIGISLMVISGIAGTISSEIVEASTASIGAGAVVYFGAGFLGLTKRKGDD